MKVMTQALVRQHLSVDIVSSLIANGFRQPNSGIINYGDDTYSLHKQQLRPRKEVFGTVFMCRNIRHTTGPQSFKNEFILCGRGEIVWSLYRNLSTYDAPKLLTKSCLIDRRT